jgi:hypothetical protein
MFADDTLALKSDNDLNCLITELNRDINKMAIWFKANKLVLNKSKTKFIIFHSKGKKLPAVIPDVVIDENENGLPHDQNNITVLERLHNKHERADSRSYKLLGIYFDEHLTFDFHINHLSSKLTKSLYCIRLAKNNLSYKGLRSLYFALIHSHLSYCPIILSCTSITNRKKLFKVQKKAIRIITNSRYNAHTNQLFLDHKILPVEQLFKQGKMLFMHSVYYNYAPKSFRNTWIKNDQRQNDLNLRNGNLFAIPAPRTENFKKFPLFSLPKMWNESGELMFYENPITFRFSLREKLLSELTDQV